jgi:hypothetical protein
MTERMNEETLRLLLGFGLDGSDGHVRFTRGPNFRLFGGSHCTHERMQVTCMKFNEELRRRGKSINDVDRDEAVEIIRGIEQGL